MVGGEQVVSRWNGGPGLGQVDRRQEEPRTKRGRAVEGTKRRAAGSVQEVVCR